MPSRCSTVIAADDHPVVLSGIRLLLRGEEKFELLAETRNAAETLLAVLKAVPDFLILDLWMGGNDGIDLIRRIHSEWPSIHILVYSMNDERSYGVRAFRAGASGYLMKTHGLDELLHALRTIAAGKRFMSPELAAEVIGHSLDPTKKSLKSRKLSALSDRELQILRLIGIGCTTAVIAKNLGISTKTVGAHRENLKNKLNLDNAVALSQEAAKLVESREL